MEFKYYLLEQVKKHPNITPVDIAKLCYQSAYGAEHLLKNLDFAWNYLEKEYEQVSPADGELFERICEDVCRINLCVWKFKALPLEWLFRMFAASAAVSTDAKDQLKLYLSDAEALVKQGLLPISSEEWTSFHAEYTEHDMPPVRHSALYREKEAPFYRIVHSRFISILPILEKISFDSEDIFLSIKNAILSNESETAALLSIAAGIK